MACAIVTAGPAAAICPTVACAVIAAAAVTAACTAAATGPIAAIATAVTAGRGNRGYGDKACRTCG